MIAARLSDVLPDGSVTRFTYGLLNLTHRERRRRPRPMEPGKRETLTVSLNHIGQRIPAGNRLRLSLSTSYWPLAWPAPEPVFLTVYLEGSTLAVPVRPTGKAEPEHTPLGEPRLARPKTKTLIKPERHEWFVHRNLANDASELEVIDDRGVYQHEYTGLEVGARAEERYRSIGNDISSVEGETNWTRTLSRGDDWHIRTETRTVLRSDVENFYLQGDLDAFENGKRVFCRTWNRTSRSSISATTPRGRRRISAALEVIPRSSSSKSRIRAAIGISPPVGSASARRTRSICSTGPTSRTPCRS